MMYYNYSICGIHIRVEVPYPLTITEESIPFLREEDGKWDLCFRFTPVSEIQPPAREIPWTINSKFLSTAEGHDAYHCAVRSRPPYCHVRWRKEQPELLLCEYVPEGKSEIAFTGNLIQLLGLEMVLLQRDGLILHASLVRWRGRAILFSAPSGTGKSTQASLWQQYMGSETLNGDRAGLRYVDDGWRAYGLPFAGTSGIYRNESAPLGAIVLLAQGPENVIRKVRPAEAMAKLFPECSARREDPAFMGRLLEILSGLIMQIPVYRLECRPDQGAVQLLHDTIMEEETWQW